MDNTLNAHSPISTNYGSEFILIFLSVFLFSFTSSSSLIAPDLVMCFNIVLPIEIDNLVHMYFFMIHCCCCR